MDVKTPPSPTPSDHEFFQNKFQHLIEHNKHVLAACPQYESPVVVPSRYSTPVPSNVYPPFETSSPQSLQGTSYQVGNESGSSPYNVDVNGNGNGNGNVNMMNVVESHPYSSPNTSPRTPSEYGKNIRPFRLNSTRAPRPAARRKQKPAKKVDKVAGPLSTMVKDYPDVEVADIDTFVNRDSEQRVREIEDVNTKAPGRIKRPMNAFMLYRKAYQNLAKQLCTQNNHQLVSQVCGAGWPQEPESVREQFNAWAKTERTNHQLAHPDYKFTPAKPKPKDDELTHSGNESDAHDPEWTVAAAGNGRARREGASRAGQRRTGARSRGGGGGGAKTIELGVYTPVMAASRMAGLDMHSPQPLYQNTIITGSAMPTQYDQNDDDLFGQYYQPHVMANPHMGGFVDDLRLRKTPSPSPGAGAFAGSMDGFDMMGNHPLLSGPLGGLDGSDGQHIMDGMIDPTLMSAQDSSRYGHHPFWGDAGHHTSDPHMALDDNLLMQDPQLGYLRGNEDDWQVEELDTEGQFSNWELAVKQE